jgi:UTP--glucose-1-phosphate uridylyltransferase
MKMKVRKAVFPAAGLGTRFLPATKAQPKEMLPVVDKPIIQYGVEEAMASGCDQIVIITGRGKQAIEDHFDVSYELEKMLEERGKTDLLKIVRNISDMMYVAYVRQKEALGLGHAVLMARELVGNEAFAVLLADDVIDNPVPCLKQMVDVFDQKQCSVIAAQVVEGKMISSYGVFDAQPAEGFNGRLFEIRNMVEKPKPEEAPSNLAIIGRYILTPAIFDCLAKTKTGAGGELHAYAAEAGKNVRLRLRRPPLRYWRQTRISQGDGRICSQAQRPRGPVPRISERAETLTSSPP